VTGRMNPGVRDAWVAALRSGEFTRTTGKLTRVDVGPDDAPDGTPVGYCCLGVLCELARRAGVPLTVSDDLALGVRWYDGVDDFLPVAVRDWAGLREADPAVDASVVTVAALDVSTDVAGLLDELDDQNQTTVTLSTLNDHPSGSFAVVAAVLERGRSS
jgi:hypothetical protein